MFWKWSKKKEPVYHVGNEDVAVPEVHTGKVAHEQAAQQDTGEKENIGLPALRSSLSVGAQSGSGMADGQ